MVPERSSLASPAPLPEQGHVLDRSYVLGESLGEGGMGAVHLATRRTDSRVVALKLVANLGRMDARSHEREPWLAIAREFEILSSLHHPNVVRVIDYGFDERLGPYFAMEYLPAASDLLAAGRDASLNLKIELLAQLLRALAYVHRRGIIHRDIKPSNVLCVDGRVKLLDFGVATSERGPRRIAGTRPYMAPELLTGAAPSVRSDLYAFGVLAGALLGGWAMASAVSTTRITEMRPGESLHLPKLRSSPAAEDMGTAQQELDVILAKLCAPAPEDRYGSAGEVLAELGRAVGRELPLDTSETRESYLQASEFVGREAEMTELILALDAALGGAGSGWLVGGESGVGKSRLVSELETLAMVRGVHVAHGQAQAEGAGSYEVWLPLLRSLCLQASLDDETLAILKELLPDLPVMLERAIPDAPKVRLSLAEERLGRAIETLFRRQTKPILLVLEDLQWAGADSISLLVGVTRYLPELRLMILANYRNDEAPELPKLLRSLRSLELPRLGQPEVARLSASMLGARAGRPEFVEYLCRETEGNPFFLVEVVRALAEQVGQLDQVSRGELPEGLLTGGIERIVQHRVGRVPSDFHPLLEVAAAIGRRLDLRLLSRLAGDVDLESWLLTCANAAVLESRADEWRFAHDKLREALLSRLSAERRAPLYRAVVAVAEETYDAAERAHKSAALAHYAEQAEDGDRAALYHLQAADLATHRCAYLVARKHYAAAIEWLARLPANEQRSRLFIDARLKQVYVTMVSDSPETNLARMAEVKDRLAALANGGEPTQADRLRLARANYFMGRVHFYRGDPRQAVLCYREVLPVARESGDDELLALPSCLIAIALAIQGKMLEAEPLLSLSIEPLERLGEPFEWFRAVGYRGFTLVALGRCAEGDHELLRVHERARKIEQPSLSSAAHLMRGSASILLKGDLAAGLADMQQVLYFAKQTGDGLHASLAHNNSAWALAQLGRHEEARASRRKGLEAAAEMGGRLMLADWHEAADAEMELLAGRYEQALALADAVRRSSREQDLVASLGIAERVYAEALAALNRFAEAEPHFEASLEAFARGGIALQVARTHLRRAVWRKRVGLRASADVALGLALEVFERSGLSAAAEQAAGTYRDA